MGRGVTQTVTDYLGSSEAELRCGSWQPKPR
jgi:hypothetical protein